ncbi:MAG: hypothetical protein LBM67_08340 [Lentimicrobiaceae bacterium]|jgi:hypothetical protein|nr:hypothetical protein [Lentimicrobiaceae bacterium]
MRINKEFQAQMITIIFIIVLAAASILLFSCEVFHHVEYVTRDVYHDNMKLLCQNSPYSDMYSNDNYAMAFQKHGNSYSFTTDDGHEYYSAEVDTLIVKRDTSDYVINQREYVFIVIYGGTSPDTLAFKINEFASHIIFGNHYLQAEKWKQN